MVKKCNLMYVLTKRKIRACPECVEGNNTTNIKKEQQKKLGSVGERYDLDLAAS